MAVKRCGKCKRRYGVFGSGRNHPCPHCAKEKKARARRRNFDPVSMVGYDLASQAMAKPVKAPKNLRANPHQVKPGQKQIVQKNRPGILDRIFRRSPAPPASRSTRSKPKPAESHELPKPVRDQVIRQYFQEQRAKAIARNPRRRNVEFGFRDSTGFHPIRASRDYSASRAGEVGSRSLKSVSRARRSAGRSSSRGRLAAPRRQREAARRKIASYSVSARTGRRNPSAEDLFKEFHGRPVTKWSEVRISKKLPALRREGTAQTGRLRSLTILKPNGKTEKISFRGKDAHLVRAPEWPNKLAIANQRFAQPGRRRNPEAWLCAGRVLKTDYDAIKPHVGPAQMTWYGHNHGEETGKLPAFLIDREGYGVITGGKLQVKSEGITD
jgi:hypothetical protein